MKIVNTKHYIMTIKYKNYYLDIMVDDDDNTYEVWIYRKNIGVKMFCYGVNTFDIEMLNEVSVKEYIELYEDYIKED